MMAGKATWAATAGHVACFFVSRFRAVAEPLC
jgi:hypothetical protein